MEALGTVLASQRQQESTTTKHCTCGNEITPITVNDRIFHWPNACEECQDKDEVWETKPHIRKADVIKRYRNAGLENRELPAHFKNFKPQPKLKNNVAAYQAALQFATGKLDRGLYLISTPGAGKTHLSASALKVEVNRGVKAKFLDCRELLGLFRESNSPKAEKGETELLKELCAYDVLHLDDLGACRQKDYTIDIFDRLIARLNRLDKRVFVTSNLTRNELAQQFDDRIASRLSEMCQVISYESTDFRLVKEEL